MNNNEYMVLAEGLTAICQSKEWRKKLQTVLKYAEDPTLEFPRLTNPYTKALAEFGRRNPEALLRLVSVVERYFRGEVDYEYWDEERKADLEKAWEIVRSQERPKKTLDAVKTFAASDKPWGTAFRMRPEEAPLKTLVAFARSNPNEFALQCDIIMRERQLKTEESAQNIRNTFLNRRNAMKTIVNYKYPEEKRPREMEAAIADCMIQRTTYLEEHKGEKPYYQLLKDFNSLYDEELFKTAELIRSARKGLALNKNMIMLPKVVKIHTVKDKRITDDKFKELKSKCPPKQQRGRSRS